MKWLAPWFLLGLPVVGLPVLIHLMGRPREKRVPFAALEFLFPHERKTRNQWRLHEWLLLTLRMLLIATVVTAFAKPYATCQRTTPVVQHGAQAAVILIDDSLVSGLQLEDHTVWLNRAKARAKSLLTELGPASEVAVLSAARGAPMPTELTRNQLRLRSELDELTPRTTPPATMRALATAHKLLNNSAHSRRTIYVLSLLTEAGFRQASPPWNNEGPALVVLEIPAPKRDNIAITDVTLAPEPMTGPRGLAVDVVLHNASATPLANHPIDLRLDDILVARATVAVGAYQTARRRFTTSLPQNRASVAVEVRIPPDALPVDNVRYARAHQRNEIRVLALNGDQRVSRRDDETYYLELALRPGDRLESGITAHTVAPEEFSASMLGETDVIMLANVARLSAGQLAALVTWVRGGGGVFISLGNNTTPTGTNAQLGPLLPLPLAELVDASLRTQVADERQGQLHISEWRSEHPIFQPLPPASPELTDAGFRRIMLLGPRPRDGLHADILARFTNGAPALVEAALGQGRVVLFASTIDREWNELPIYPAFVPLTQLIVRHLARRSTEQGDTVHLVGDAVLLPTTAVTALEVRTPEPRVVALSPAAIRERQWVRFDDTMTPGHYTVRGAAAGKFMQRDDLGFAVNLDASGADLRAVPERLPASNDKARDPTRFEEQVKLWPLLALFALSLLVLEGLVLQRR